jgi:hypothetical protein
LEGTVICQRKRSKSPDDIMDFSMCIFVSLPMVRKTRKNRERERKTKSVWDKMNVRNL